MNPALAQRKFERKECLDCHTKFAGKYLGMKTIHAVVKEKKCEDCHLRHGKVPRCLLKKSGNDLCYTATARRKWPDQGEGPHGHPDGKMHQLP